MSICLQRAALSMFALPLCKVPCIAAATYPPIFPIESFLKVVENIYSISMDQVFTIIRIKIHKSLSHRTGSNENLPINPSHWACWVIYKTTCIASSSLRLVSHTWRNTKHRRFLLKLPNNTNDSNHERHCSS